MIWSFLCRRISWNTSHPFLFICKFGCFIQVADKSATTCSPQAEMGGQWAHLTNLGSRAVTIWYTGRPHHIHEVCHLTLVVTSFLTFGHFSVNDLPSGIMGKLSGALGELTQSYWVTAAPGGWVTTRICIILRELDKNRNGSTQPQPELHFLVRPQDHTLAVTQHNTIFPQRCIPSIRNITIFSTMRLLMVLFMYECHNERQMEAIEQRTSSWEDDLNVGPINCVWRGMGVCST